MILNLEELCHQYEIEPRGVIHIGAHEGTELTTYRKMRIGRLLFIEANPPVFERLKANVAGAPDIDIVNCAITNENGVASLHVTSMDQSSSILPLKLHKELYPNIRETHQVEVSSRKLDTLLEELQISPQDFNIMNIDIQGAELLAFQGAKNLLRHIEAISTEVNFEELYEGCALINQIDDFLGTFGFVRVSTRTPYHPSWGDAFYVKKAGIINQKSVITMSTLGQNGRFANQIFQYAFLKIYAKEHDLGVETSEWIGRYLFGHKDPLISRQLPVRRILLPQDHTRKNFPDALIIDNPEPLLSDTEKTLGDVDLWGYFQFHTKYYAPYKEYFISLFEPVPEIKEKIDEALSRLRSKGKTIVGLHLRRRDYGYGPFFIAPNEWYLEWLDGLWGSLDAPVLFIASDDPEKVIKDFERYCPVTSQDLGIELPQAEFYPDFYLLSQCDVVAISNSSYSFAACMLNKEGKLFMRPHLPSYKLIEFDPWDSEVLFYDEEILQSADNYLEHGDLQQARNICQEIVHTHPRDVIGLAWSCIEKSAGTGQPCDDLYCLVGKAFMETGEPDKAIGFLKEALKSNPGDINLKGLLENAIAEKKYLNQQALTRCGKVQPNQNLADLCRDKFDKIHKEYCRFAGRDTFIVCAMFTPGKPILFEYAKRLADSCRKYKIPYVIYEVPRIHMSISPAGDSDPAYTKASLIYFNMMKFPSKNILYLDIDVFFVDYPTVIMKISKSDYDFAIYNWLNDRSNEAYLPVNRKIAEDDQSAFYVFSHCIPYYSTDQLLCSGAVQFYRNSPEARYLLECWQTILADNPDYPDDECLDYSFNNFILDVETLKPFWLDKSYIRYPWWPHVKPVILHPDIPNPSERKHVGELKKRQRFYPERVHPKSNDFFFPQGSVIDTNKQLLLKPDQGNIYKFPFKHRFWIYPTNIGLVKT